MYDVKGNLREVLGNLPAEVNLVAISKFHPNEYIEAAYAEENLIVGCLCYTTNLKFSADIN